MKLPEIFKKISLSKNGVPASKFRISGSLALGVVLGIIIAFELYIAYTSIWKNVVFSDEVDPRTVDAAVRINFDNYNRVTDRLDKVADFEAPASIDFTGEDPNIGRTNPFSDPE